MDIWVYLGLFSSCFLSATIIPVASEIGLAIIISQGYSPVIAVLVATAGNSLGGLTNYLLGMVGNPKWLQKTKLSEEKISKYSFYINKYGSILALLSWVPIIGDPLLIVLGFLRVRFIPVLLFMILGKLVRYVVIACFF
jgi:membrane protein YqaA with SNARE-associated domain